MNLFELARLQVKREGKLKDSNVDLLILDRAMKIRKYLDIQERNIKVLKARWNK